MILSDWHRNGWLRPHKATPRQIADLFLIVERNLKDAQTEDLTSDWKFGIAYNAALKLCTILLHAEGYRPENNLAHYRTIKALSVILGEDRDMDVAYLETCRIKRNKVEYDTIDQATPEQAAELIAFVIELRETVMEWLRQNHPAL